MDQKWNKLGLKLALVWDAGITGGDIIHCATMPVPLLTDQLSHDILTPNKLQNHCQKMSFNPLYINNSNSVKNGKFDFMNKIYQHSTLDDKTFKKIIFAKDPNVETRLFSILLT